MTLETDLLIDRRRLKRRLVFWRVAALLAVLGAAVLAIDQPSGITARDHVTRVTFAGTITEQRRTLDALAALVEDDSAKAVIIAIDSPGGSVSGGEALHNALLKVAAKKPMVAVMGATAASAGYMVAMPAARIFAREATMTGSIGVLLMTGEASGLLRMLGITDETITSGPLKNQPSFSRPLSEAGREVLHTMVMDMYEQFVTMVANGRKMDPARVRELADGRPYTGRQALKLGLIDAIGGEADARAWLAAERAVPVSLPVQELRPLGLRERVLGDGTESIFEGFVKILLSQRVSLDGAWSVWQVLATRP